MLMRLGGPLIVCLCIAACTAHRDGQPVGESATPAPASRPAPLVVGESFTIESRVLDEARPVNAFLPSVYGRKLDAPLPVLYMPDGGLDEDFLHIAGLVQVLVSNGGMRPFILVGIPNTDRKSVV